MEEHSEYFTKALPKFLGSFSKSFGETYSQRGELVRKRKLSYQIDRVNDKSIVIRLSIH